MRFDTPQQIIKTGQIIPTEQLLRIAEEWGFSAKKQTGSSHMRLVHETHPEHAFDIIINTSKVATQRELARLYIKIQQQEAASKQALRDKFAQKGENRLNAIREQLPAHITAELTQNGLVILRDAQIPQIGVTLYSPEEDRLIANKIHNEIEPMKREMFIALSVMHTEYDAQAEFEDGVFTGRIRHEVYETLPDLELPVYEEGSRFDIKTALAAYQESILDKDLEHLVRKEEYLNAPQVGAVTMSFSARRGERHNYVRLNIGDHGALSMKFTTFSNRRITGDGSVGRIAESELDKMKLAIIDAKEISAHLKTVLPERHAA